MQAGKRVPAGPGSPFWCSNEVQGAEGDRGAAGDDRVFGQWSCVLSVSWLRAATSTCKIQLTCRVTTCCRPRARLYSGWAPRFGLAKSTALWLGDSLHSGRGYRNAVASGLIRCTVLDPVAMHSRFW